MEETKNSADIALLQTLYRGVSMDSDAILTLLGKAKKEDLRQELTEQLDGYQNFANITRDRLSELSVAAKEVGALAKLPSELSLKMATLTDDSPARIAELMIESSTAGIVSLQKQVSEAQQSGVSPDNVELADGVLNFRQKNINKMKAFL